jgi:hypothetical protein
MGIPVMNRTYFDAKKLSSTRLMGQLTTLTPLL